MNSCKSTYPQLFIWLTISAWTLITSWPCELLGQESDGQFTLQGKQTQRPNKIKGQAIENATGGIDNKNGISPATKEDNELESPPSWTTCHSTYSSAVPVGWCKNGDFYGIVDALGLFVISSVDGNYYGLIQSSIWSYHHGKMYSIGQLGLVSASDYLLYGLFQIGLIVGKSNEFRGGVQLAGIIGNAKEFYGILQIATIADSKEFYGVSSIGGFNMSTNFHGLAMLGIVNWSDNITGTQIGAFNRAKYVKGVQIGAYNTTETLKGIQIGVLNHVENGMVPFMVLMNAGI